MKESSSSVVDVDKVEEGINAVLENMIGHSGEHDGTAGNIW